MSNYISKINVSVTVKDLDLAVKPDQVDYVQRILDTPLDPETFAWLSTRVKSLEVGEELRKVVDYFKGAPGNTPAGFRRDIRLKKDGVLEVDLVRDISKDKDGKERPTKVLYSADSANPYEVAPIAPMLANLTCNPGIIYDLFLNNPEANVGNKYKDRDEVMTSIGDILGPGADISVELNNPFEQDFSKILEEVHRFEEILSPWRLVVKVPHTGPVNHENYTELLEGTGRLGKGFDKGTTADALRGHDLALRLHEEGYRVNFTLMFEPFQTQMALQARPYFINSFIRHRKMQTERIIGLLKAYELSHDAYFLVQLREYLAANDYIGADEKLDDLSVIQLAQTFLTYRGVDVNTDEFDGLDGVRHNLRALRNSNLEDTRLIICSMEGTMNYPDIDRLLMEDEFKDMADRVVVTAEPQYLARFTSTNQVVSYQRRFMKAAAGQA